MRSFVRRTLASLGLSQGANLCVGSGAEEYLLKLLRCERATTRAAQLEGRGPTVARAHGARAHILSLGVKQRAVAACALFLLFVPASRCWTWLLDLVARKLLD